MQLSLKIMVISYQITVTTGFPFQRLQFKTMRNLRRQTKLMSSLAETVLQYRLNPFTGLSQHLCQVRKKIRNMIYSQCYQDGITQMLVSKQNYQIKNKITKFMHETNNQKLQQIWIHIRISAIQKISGQKYNSELWQFGINIKQQYNINNCSKASACIIQLIQYVLRYLMCYSLLPLNKQHRNKYMLDHKVTITDCQQPVSVLQFGNTSKKQVLLSIAQQQNNCKILIKYSFNQRKIQQSLKQNIASKNMDNSQHQKKNSLDTTDSYKKVSLYQFYDDQLDITVLSGSDFSSENGEEIQLDLENIQEEDQFQILIQETVSQDQLFLKNNLSLFKEFNYHLNSYL